MLSLLPVAILAGGLATRLRPITEGTPKSLLPLAGRPFIFHQLELLRGQGVEQVVLCLGHLGEQIRAAVEVATPAGMHVSCSFDGVRLLGTGGALRKALHRLGTEFFVLYGDSYFTCPLQRIQEAYVAARRPALMTVTRNENRWDRSNVLFSHGTLLSYDKRAPRSNMSHIDCGVSVLSSRVLAQYSSADVLDLADVLRDLALRGELAAFEAAERFYEIGSLQGLRDTEAFLARGAKK